MQIETGFLCEIGWRDYARVVCLVPRVIRQLGLWTQIIQANADYLFSFLCCFFVFPFSLFECIGVAGVCMLWHGIVLLLSTWCNVAAYVVVLWPQSLYFLCAISKGPYGGQIVSRQWSCPQRYNYVGWKAIDTVILIQKRKRKSESYSLRICGSKICLLYTSPSPRD